MIVLITSVIQVPPENEGLSLLPGVYRRSESEGGCWCVGDTRGDMPIHPGDWIITLVSGHKHVLKYSEATPAEAQRVPEPQTPTMRENDDAPAPLTRGSLFQRVFQEIAQAGSWPHRGAG